MTILLLSGSPSTPSRSSRLLHFVGDKLSELGHHVVHISLRDLPAQALLHADFKNAELAAIRQQIAEADTVVVATPVYKAAYSGLLKLFLDMLPQDGLKDKLVLPIATGGSQSHMLALDYALRPVLAALDAKHILPSVYATDAQIVWSEQDGLRLDPAIEKRLHIGIHQLNEGLALSEFNRLKSATALPLAPVATIAVAATATAVATNTADLNRSHAAAKVPCTA